MPVSVKFNGYPVNVSRGLNITRTVGTQPDSVVLTLGLANTDGLIAPDDRGFDLAINDGNGGLRTLRDWTPFSPELVQAQSTYLCALTARDGRWRWHYRYICGEYNKVRADGVGEQDAHLKNLVLLVFLKLGYSLSKVDVSAVSEALYPYVNWPPTTTCAAALDELLGTAGYWIVYKADTSVQIVKRGEGADLSDVGSFERRDATVRDPAILAEPVIIGSRVMLEEAVTLTPVGLDTDGTVKRLNLLSYAPNSGGTYGGFDNMLDCPLCGKTAWTDAQLQCYQASVFRMWQLVETPRRVTPTYSSRSAIELAGPDSIEKPLPPKVLVDRMAEWNGPIATDDVIGREFIGGFSYDPVNARVTFSRVMISSINKPTAVVPVVTLTVAYPKRTEEGNIDDDCYYRYQENSDATLLAVENHPEMVLRGTRAAGVESYLNKTVLDSLAQARVAELRKRDSEATIKGRTYAGVKALECSGLIPAVTWVIGEGQCFTRAESNRQHMGVAIPDFRQKLARSRMAYGAAMAKQDVMLRYAWAGTGMGPVGDAMLGGEAAPAQAAVEKTAPKMDGTTTSGAVPANAPVQVTGVSGGKLTFAQVTNKLKAYAVALTAMPSAGRGMVGAANQTLIAVESDVAAGDRVGPKLNAWTAERDPSGPWIVTAIVGTSPRTALCCLIGQEPFPAIVTAAGSPGSARACNSSGTAYGPTFSVYPTYRNSLYAGQVGFLGTDRSSPGTPRLVFFRQLRFQYLTQPTTHYFLTYGSPSVANGQYLRGNTTTASATVASCVQARVYCGKFPAALDNTGEYWHWRTWVDSYSEVSIAPWAHLTLNPAGTALSGLLTLTLKIRAINTVFPGTPSWSWFLANYASWPLIQSVAWAGGASGAQQATQFAVTGPDRIMGVKKNDAVLAPWWGLAAYLELATTILPGAGYWMDGGCSITNFFASPSDEAYFA
jgi:hypothetical protein